MSSSDARHLEKAQRIMNRAQQLIAAAKKQHGEDFRVGTVNMISAPGGIHVEGSGLFASSSTIVHGQPPPSSTQSVAAEGGNPRSMVINTVTTSTMSTTGTGTITANYESFTGGATRGAIANAGGGDSINFVTAGTMQAAEQSTISGVVRHSDRPVDTNEPDNIRQVAYVRCQQSPQTTEEGMIAGIVDSSVDAHGQTHRDHRT